MMMNACFGKNWINYQKGFFPLDESKTAYLWFPKMAKKDGDKWIGPKNSPWTNTLSEDGRTIIELNDNDENWPVVECDKELRYVFGRFEKNGNQAS